jgi:hypothetical protein
VIGLPILTLLRSVLARGPPALVIAVAVAVVIWVVVGLVLRTGLFFVGASRAR